MSGINNNLDPVKEAEDFKTIVDSRNRAKNGEEENKKSTPILECPDPDWTEEHLRLELIGKSGSRHKASLQVAN